MTLSGAAMPTPDPKRYDLLKQQLEQGIVWELRLPEPPCVLEPDPQWPAPRIRLGIQSGKWGVLDESRMEDTGRVAINPQSIRALGERMPPMQWLVCASIGIEMLLPLWAQFRERWRPYLEGMVGHHRRHADVPWTAEQIGQIIHMPETVLRAIPRWIDQQRHGQGAIDFGFPILALAGVRRADLFTQLQMNITPGVQADQEAGRYDNLGFETQLEFADYYLSAIYHPVALMTLDRRDDTPESFIRGYSTSTLYRLGTAVVTWTQYQILLRQRQAGEARNNPGILVDPENPSHQAVQEQVVQRFFDRWWELCRCRLAFVDAPTATLEGPAPENHTHESGEGIWFTSDHHFFHKNIIRYTERPFPFVATMNEEMLRRWNERVKPDDLVYYVGDLIFVYDDQWDQAFRFLDRLNGRIVMIEGNHDIERKGKKTSRPLQRHPKIIEWHSSKGGGLSVQVEGVKLLLDHYPAGIWKGKEDGVAHLYGHTHTTEVKPGWMLRLNVGVDAHDFRPWSWGEVKEFLSQCKDWKKFYESAPPNTWADLDQSALGGPSHIENPGRIRLETIINHGIVRILAWIGETKVGEISARRSDYIWDAYRTACIEVETPFRGQGIGQTLYLAMLDLVGRLHPDWLFGMSNEAQRTWSRLDGAITPEGSRVRAIVPASVDPPTLKPGVDDDPDEWVFTLPKDAYGDDLEPTSKIRAVLPTVVLEPTGDERKTTAEDALVVFTVMELTEDDEPNEVGTPLSPNDPERHFPRDYERQLLKLQQPTPRRINPLDIVHPRGKVYGETPPPTNQAELVDLLAEASEIMLLRAMLTAWDIGKHPPYHSDPALSAHIETMLHEIQRMVDTHEHLRIEYHHAARAVERAYHADQQGMPLSVDQETLLLVHMLIWVVERIDLWVIPDEPGEPLEKPTPMGGDELTFAASVINTLAQRNPGFYAHWWDEFRRRIPFEDALTATLEGPDPSIYYQMLERLNYPESHRQEVPGLLFQPSSGSLRLTPDEVQVNILSLSPTNMAYAALVALSMLHEEVLAHYDMNTPTSAWSILDHAMERLPRLFQQVLTGTPIEGQLARMFGNVRWASNPTYPDQLQVGNAIAWTMELLTPLNPGAHSLPSRMAEHLWQAVHSAAEAYAILASSQGVQTAFYGRWWELVSQRLAFMDTKDVTLEGPNDDRVAREEAIIVRNEATPQGQQLVADMMKYFGKNREEARRALLHPTAWLGEVEARKAAHKQHDEQHAIDALWDAQWVLERRMLADPHETSEEIAIRFAEVLRDRRGRARRSPVKQKRDRLHPDTGHEEILWRIGSEWYRSLREPADRTGKQLVSFYRLTTPEETDPVAKTIQGTRAESETVATRAAGKQSVVIGRLLDAESPDLAISIGMKKDRYSSDWKVVLGYTLEGKRRSETIAFVGIRDFTPTTEVIQRVQDYLDAGTKGRFRAEYQAPAPSKPKPEPSPMDAVRKELKHLESIRYKTAHVERQIEHLKAILASKPEKWKVGMGVRWLVAGKQWNRGFRIVEVQPDERKALIVQVADTGLTRTGADDPIDRTPTMVWLADLKRDKKYDAPGNSTVSGTRPTPDDYEQMRHVLEHASRTLPIEEWRQRPLLPEDPEWPTPHVSTYQGQQAAEPTIQRLTPQQQLLAVATACEMVAPLWERAIRVTSVAPLMSATIPGTNPPMRVDYHQLVATGLPMIRAAIEDLNEERIRQLQSLQEHIVRATEQLDEVEEGIPPEIVRMRQRGAFLGAAMELLILAVLTWGEGTPVERFDGILTAIFHTLPRWSAGGNWRTSPVQDFVDHWWSEVRKKLAIANTSTVTLEGPKATNSRKDEAEGLVIVHADSLASYGWHEGKDVARSLAALIEQAIREHAGPVVVLTQGWEEPIAQPLITAVTEREDGIVIQHDESVEGSLGDWNRAADEVVAFLRSHGAKRARVGGVWYDPADQAGCVNTVVDLLVTRGLPATVAGDLVGEHSDDEDACETMGSRLLAGLADADLKRLQPLPNRELGPMAAPASATSAEGRTLVSPEWIPPIEGPTLDLRQLGYEFLGVESFTCGGVTNRVPIYRHWAFHEALVDAGVASIQARHPASEFVLIPPDRFLMGSPNYDDEQPVHEVSIGYSFLLARTPVVQAVWDALAINENRSNFAGALRPVENVSWIDCDNTFLPTTGLRFPSEAEWEYACRAGTTTKWFFGDDESQLRNYAWFWGNSGGGTHPVATHSPNAFGLYDMHGNVWEWCQDDYADYAGYYGAPTDGSAHSIADAHLRVVRGGSWLNDAVYCRSANRGGSGPGWRLDDLGFRPVQTVDPRDWAWRQHYQREAETTEGVVRITTNGPDDLTPEEQTKIEGLATLGAAYRLPPDIPQHVFTNPASMSEADKQTWRAQGRRPPEAGPYHGLMVYRKFDTIDDAIHFYRYIENTRFRFEQDKKMGITGPVLEVGYLKHLDLPLHTGKRSGMFIEFCKVGYVFPKQHTFEVRSSYGGDCVNSRVEWLDEYEPFDQSSPFARAMIRHLRNTSDWTSWQSIFSDDRMTDTSLDPTQAHHFGEWWSKEWERLRTPGQKHEHVYHITYPSQIAAIRDSGKLLAFRGFSRLTYCPEQMVGNTFGASRFIRIPIKDLPPLIDVHYDAAFVRKHPEIAETISEYLWDIDRDRLDDDAYVHAAAAEIARYMRECETVVPGDLILPPSTEWGIPALGVMGKLFASR